MAIMAANVKTMRKRVYKCPEHGTFRGFAWFGHARNCEAARTKGRQVGGPQTVRPADRNGKEPVSRIGETNPRCPTHGTIPTKLWKDHLQACSIARAKTGGQPLGMKRPVDNDTNPVDETFSKNDPLLKTLNQRYKKVETQIQFLQTKKVLLDQQLNQLSEMKTRLFKALEEMTK